MSGIVSFQSDVDAIHIDPLLANLKHAGKSGRMIIHFFGPRIKI